MEQCIIGDSEREASPARRHYGSEGERVIDRTTRLLSLTMALADVSTTEDVAEAALEYWLTLVKAARGFFACVVGRRLTVVSARGYSDEMRARIMRLNETSRVPLVDAARTGEPVWLESVEDYVARYPSAFRSFGAVSGTQAHVAVPLIYRATVIGCVGYSFPAPTAFGAADRAFMLLVSQVVAGALHRARRYDAEVQRREQAERIAAARAETLGVVAHDLRDPLSLIDMTAQFLLEVDPASERRREMLATTRRAAARMDRLVDDLLDAVRMQSGTLRLDLREVDVGALLRAVEEGYRALAEKSRIVLRVDVVDQPVYARGDEARIVQAIGNLIGNALKFTRPEGSVSLSVVAGERDVTFSVTDTGPGIPESERCHVFDRFWQARSGKQKGRGLGLAIVKGIVDAHGGRIWLESAVGVGSTFAFTLPRCTRVHEMHTHEDVTRAKSTPAGAAIAAA